MFRRCLLIPLICAASACALGAPSAFAASSGQADGQGTVLSFGGRGVRLVGADHRVGGVRVSSTRGLRRGDVVTVHGGRARVTAHVRKVAFLGRVLRSSAKGAVVRLGDGSSFGVGGGSPHRGGRKARSARGTVDFEGLQPGQSLLITIQADGRGNVAIAIRVLSPRADIGDGELHAAGVVTDDEGDGWFAIDPRNGGELGFEDPQRRFEDAGAAWCDLVDVTYHAAGGALVADAVRVTGRSGTGDCAEDDLGDEVEGTVTAIAPDASSLTIAPGGGRAAATYQVDDPLLLDGIEVGDKVTVTLGDDGVAIDVALLGWSGDFDPGDDGGDE